MRNLHEQFSMAKRTTTLYTHLLQDFHSAKTCGVCFAFDQLQFCESSTPGPAKDCFFPKKMLGFFVGFHVNLQGSTGCFLYSTRVWHVETSRRLGGPGTHELAVIFRDSSFGVSTKCGAMDDRPEATREGGAQLSWCCPRDVCGFVPKICNRVSAMIDGAESGNPS